MRRLNDILSTAIAMGIGFLMTVSLLIDGLGENILALLRGVGAEPLLRSFAPTVVSLITITIAFTIVIGLANLLAVHVGRTVRFKPDSIFSLLLVLSATAVLVVVIMERGGRLTAPAGDPSYTTVLRNTVLNSVEATLAGLLAFSLVYGAARLTRTRVSVETIAFLISLVVSLVVRAGFGAGTLFQDLPERLIDAGATGVLLGIALATVAAGVRILIG
ncbi:MAG: hypothetical protein AAGK74_18260, partial [Chloroflexota bacterium]